MTVSRSLKKVLPRSRGRGLRRRGGATFECPRCARPTKVMRTTKEPNGTIVRDRQCGVKKCGWRGTTRERHHR
jgi:transcription elongation factor Elf1